MQSGSRTFAVSKATASGVARIILPAFTSLGFSRYGRYGFSRLPATAGVPGIPSRSPWWRPGHSTRRNSRLDVDTDRRDNGGHGKTRPQISPFQLRPKPTLLTGQLLERRGRRLMFGWYSRLRRKRDRRSCRAVPGNREDLRCLRPDGSRCTPCPPRAR
jgi:hypothetical protein